MPDGFSILPLDYEGSIQHKTITVRISASTNEADYRCRSLDTHTIAIYDDKDRLIYHYSDDYRNSPQGRESSINSEIGEHLASYFNLGCPDGKYPEIDVTLHNSYYEFIDATHDEDRNKGFVSAEYEIKIHVF